MYVSNPLFHHTGCKKLYAGLEVTYDAAIPQSRARIFQWSIPHLKPAQLLRQQKMTIAIQLSGSGTLLTATDTQETYSNGEKVDTGKIISAWRANPLSAINVAGAGDSPYMNALSQEIVKHFRKFQGTAEQLEKKIHRISQKFYTAHVLPFAGRFEDANVPDYTLLLAVNYEGVKKLWTLEQTLLTESSVFACAGAGEAVAKPLLSSLYPRFPTLNALALLAAYVIYRVKSSVDGCGLETEIRFIHQDKLGLVPIERIYEWESLFRRYERVQHEIFFQAMNFETVIPIPAEFADKVPQLPPLIKSLPEIVEEIKKIRAEFAKLPVLM
jgi:hypothetical protein